MNLFSFLLLISIFIVGVYGDGISRETKKKVSTLDPRVKRTVLGLQAQGLPKHAIAEKIKGHVEKNSAHSVIDGINYEDKRNRSPASVENKKRQLKREQAAKTQRKGFKKEF